MSWTGVSSKPLLLIGLTTVGMASLALALTFWIPAKVEMWYGMQLATFLQDTAWLKVFLTITAIFGYVCGGLLLVIGVSGIMEERQAVKREGQN